MNAKERGRLLRKVIRLTMLVLMYPFAKLLRGNAIPILVYHSVDDSTISPYSLSPNKFQRQIEYLKHNGYKSISLHDLISHVHGTTQNARPKTVVLTFDDGYKNFYSGVLPVLKRYGFSAILSIVTDFCDSGISDYAPGKLPLPALSWDEIRSISDQGIEIASHGKSHVKLTSFPPEEADSEIQQSKQQIEAALNTKVDVFCYPHGAYSKQIADRVKHSGYRAAMTTTPGIVSRGDDVYRLRRTTLEPEFSFLEFKAGLTPALGWYFYLRNMFLYYR